MAVSMDGRGRCLDNVFVERLWRTVKYEDIYLHDYATPRALEAGLAKFFRFSTTRSACMRPWITLRRRLCMRRREASNGFMAVVQINAKSRKKTGKPTGTPTGMELHATARDLEGSRRDASPLHLRNRIPWLLTTRSTSGAIADSFDGGRTVRRPLARPRNPGSNPSALHRLAQISCRFQQA